MNSNLNNEQYEHIKQEYERIKQEYHQQYERFKQEYDTALEQKKYVESLNINGDSEIFRDKKLLLNSIKSSEERAFSLMKKCEEGINNINDEYNSLAKPTNNSTDNSFNNPGNSIKEQVKIQIEKYIEKLRDPCMNDPRIKELLKVKILGEAWCSRFKIKNGCKVKNATGISIAYPLGSSVFELALCNDNDELIDSDDYEIHYYETVEEVIEEVIHLCNL